MKYFIISVVIIVVLIVFGLYMSSILASRVDDKANRDSDTSNLNKSDHHRRH
jgi:hypothetical protein